MAIEDPGALRAELDRVSRELRVTRDQLRNLIDRNGDAIVVVDNHGIVRFANPAAERLFQRHSDELVGSELGVPAVVGETTEIDIVGSTEGQGMAEMRVVATEWGGEPALLAVLRDITERKRAERERAQLLREQVARAEAERALQERDDFMAMASHELKTPVSTLSATAQLLQRQLDRHDQIEAAQLRRSLDRLHEQSRRMARLVDHLLDVSRINAGRMSITPEPTDIKKLVEEVVASCQLTTSRHTISLIAPTQVEVVADPVRIEQVVTNLIDNAIKYSPSGGAIELQIEQAENEVVLCVRDHGLGIPADRLERLFERFYRAHTNQQVSGMGLGLFISQHIVELHGGSIQVESPPDDQGGTRFTVRFPLRAHGLQ